MTIRQLRSFIHESFHKRVAESRFFSNKIFTHNKEISYDDMTRLFPELLNSLDNPKSYRFFVDDGREFGFSSHDDLENVLLDVQGDRFTVAAEPNTGQEVLLWDPATQSWI